MTENKDTISLIKAFLIEMPLSSLKGLLIHFKGTLSEKEIFSCLVSADSIVSIRADDHDVYAIAQSIKGDYNQIIRQTDVHGHQTVIADLYVLSDDSVYVKPHHKDNLWLTLGSNPKIEGLFQSLPWYLTSMKPLGYLGRIWKKNYEEFCQEVACHDFSSKEIVEANAFHKLDVSGDLTLIQPNNRGCVEQFLDCENRLEIYERLINQLEAGSMVGSTMDGDQQKFAITLKCPDGKPSVMVKSNFAERPDIAERQADLLIMEHCSNEVLRKHGYEVAKTQILKSDNFIYLESERFDRTPEGGSRGFVSLRSICSATYFMGRQSEWIEALQHLHRKEFLSEKDLQTGTNLTIIGRLLDNKDMHLGNLSLWLPQDGSTVFSLAPVYDMTSMQWTPSLKGYVPLLYVFDKVPEASFELTQIAKEIWQASANHPYISANWKSFAEKKVEKFEQKLRTMFQEKEEHKTLTKINKNLMP